MKFIAFCIFLFLSTVASGTSYKSILNHNSFSIIEYAYNGYPTTDTFFISGDTLVHDTLCHKVLYSGFKNVIGVMREDTIVGKVWFRSFKASPIAIGDTDEVLLYDFNLNVGDTFNLAEYYAPFVKGDNVVDSIYYLNGNKHIRFKGKIINKNEQVEFIEGVGSNMSNIYKYRGDFFYAEYLICEYQNSTQVYQNKFYNGNCKPSLGIKPILMNAESVYPNPFYNTIAFDLGFIASQTTAIFSDIQGKNVLTQFDTKTKKIVCNTEMLSSGMYFITIRADNITIHTKVLKP